MAKQTIRIGARNVDITGLSKTQQQKVIAAAKNGGSLASRALAQQLQKKTPQSGNNNIMPTGGPNPTIQNPQGQLPGGVMQGLQSGMQGQPAVTSQQGDGQAWNAPYNPGTTPTPNVQVPGTVDAGTGQYKSAPNTLGDNKTGVSKTGTVDPDRNAGTAYNLERNDTRQNFNMNNPGAQVDEFGNRQDIVVDPSSGETRIVKTAGGALGGTMNAFNNAVGGFVGDFGQQVSNAQNANYNYMTRNLGQQKQQDLEAAKQELAQRGIPIDAGQNSLWNKTMGNINNRYQDLYDQANQQSIMLGNQTLQAQSGAQNQTLGTLANTAAAFKGQFTPYQGATIDQSGTFMDASKLASGANLTAGQTKADLEKARIMAEAQKAAAAKAAAQNQGPVFNG